MIYRCFERFQTRVPDRTAFVRAGRRERPALDRGGPTGPAVEG